MADESLAERVRSADSALEASGHGRPAIAAGELALLTPAPSTRCE